MFYLNSNTWEVKVRTTKKISDRNAILVGGNTFTWNVRKTFVLMPNPLPNLSTFFFLDIHPRQHDRQNSSSSESRGAPKCFRFFRIQKTEVMLIDITILLKSMQ
ncbi:hypothetical protein CEXT_366821 [Caerostris extrusa]|uniref:Uncharacterized protein n=1 Tax=Caerostris extrusa TaxID=172846 RepID=A0AAV4W7H7_CAEEX|nr:hypothetical protein CEXT_366821 [Caerostris extrusa]